MKKKIFRILGVSLTLVLLVSLTLSAAVMATVSQPSVIVTPESISSDAKYDIRFDTYFGLGTADYITIKFPTGTTVPDVTEAAPTSGVNIGKVTPGTAADTPSTIQCVKATNTVVIKPNTTTAYTTAPAHITVIIAADFVVGGTTYHIVNPSTPGDYTLQVKTSQEDTYVESKSYTLGIPGMVTRINKDGNFVGSYTLIQSALDAAQAKDVIRLGAGTYTEDINVADEDLTIEGSADAANTIIKGSATFDEKGLTVDNVTLKGATTVSDTNVTLKNCILEKKSKADETLLTVSATSDYLTVENCTIDTTYSEYTDTGILINDGDYVSIEGCTFTTDDGTVSAKDTAINVAATSAVNSLTVKECTFTGTKGTAYKEGNTSVTTSTVKDNTFDGYETAVDVNNAVATSKLTVQNNTISNSAGKTVGAIDVNGTTAVIIVGNTIQDGEGYSVHVAANADNVTCIGNNLVNNTYGLANTTATQMTASNNWWGDASGPSGEGTGSGDKVSTYVTYKPYLAASIAKGQAATGATSLDAEKTAGVKVSGLTSSDVIWAAKYTANPKDVDPKYKALADAYYDVYIKTGAGTATIKLYASGITKDTDAYCWSGLESKYVACSSQGASTSGGYVWVTVSSSTTPTLTDLGELPFVLVAAPEAKPSTFTLTAPDAGADTALTNVPFTWASVAEAESYELVISANADMSSPMVKVTTAGTAYTYTGTLTDGTPYYWQVIALKDTEVKGKSDVGTFVAKAPVEPTPPVVIEPAPPPVIEPVIEIPPSPLTPSVIWAIIAIGAVLVIAVIVLIVRTRRVT